MTKPAFANLRRHLIADNASIFTMAGRKENKETKRSSSIFMQQCMTKQRIVLYIYILSYKPTLR